MVTFQLIYVLADIAKDGYNNKATELCHVFNLTQFGHSYVVYFVIYGVAFIC